MAETINMTENAWIKCRECGEWLEVPWELLGDTKPADITDYVCDACDPDDSDYEDDLAYELEDDWDYDTEDTGDE